jgi:hypothetical protein
MTLGEINLYYLRFLIDGVPVMLLSLGTSTNNAGPAHTDKKKSQKMRKTTLIE